MGLCFPFKQGFLECNYMQVKLTLVISNSKGLSEILIAVTLHIRFAELRKK